MKLDPKDYDAYQFFISYIAIKTHFTSPDFNYIRGTTLTKIPFETFKKRKDNRIFYMNEKIPATDRIEFLISAFLFNKKAHISEMFTNAEMLKYHKERLSRIQSTLNNFNKDYDKMASIKEKANTDLVSLLKLGEYSKPVYLEYSNSLSLEFQAILNKFFNYTRFESKDLLWEETRFKIRKYTNLIQIDESDKKLIKQSISKLLA